MHREESVKGLPLSGGAFDCDGLEEACVGHDLSLSRFAWLEC